MRVGSPHTCPASTRPELLHRTRDPPAQPGTGMKQYQAHQPGPAKQDGPRACSCCHPHWGYCTPAAMGPGCTAPWMRPPSFCQHAADPGGQQTRQIPCKGTIHAATSFSGAPAPNDNPLPMRLWGWGKGDEVCISRTVWCVVSGTNRCLHSFTTQSAPRKLSNTSSSPDYRPSICCDYRKVYFPWDSLWDSVGFAEEGIALSHPGACKKGSPPLVVATRNWSISLMHVSHWQQDGLHTMHAAYQHG